MADVSRAIKELGLSFSDPSLEVFANRHVFPGARLKFRALGVGLDAHVSTQSMVQIRFEEARKVWFRNRAELMSRAIPAGERVMRMYRTVGTKVLYSSGMWAPSPAARQQVASFELWILREMTSLRKESGEEWVPFTGGGGARPITFERRPRRHVCGTAR